MRTIGRHGDGTLGVFKRELLETHTIVSQTVIYLPQPHLGTPTDQEIRANDRQGKPETLDIGPGHEAEKLMNFGRKNRCPP